MGTFRFRSDGPFFNQRFTSGKRQTSNQTNRHHTPKWKNHQVYAHMQSRHTMAARPYDRGKHCARACTCITNLKKKILRPRLQSNVCPLPRKCLARYPVKWTKKGGKQSKATLPSYHRLCPQQTTYRHKHRQDNKHGSISSKQKTYESYHRRKGSLIMNDSQEQSSGHFQIQERRAIF